MMKIRSIRWKLPLSYAGIALLTTLALGLALLLPLREYYHNREQGYLMNNAASLAHALAPLMTEETLPAVDLEEHIRFLGLLSQTRVRLLDAAGNELADSGLPGAQAPETVAFARAPMANMFTVAVGGGVVRGNADGPSAGQVIVESGGADGPRFDTQVDRLQIIYSGDVGGGVPAAGGPVPALPPDTLVSVMPLSSSMYGFELQKDEARSDQRSVEVFRQPIHGDQGQVLGWVVLSSGPAYGREIVSTVARSWLLASLVAIAVAGSAGWWVSRRMSRPLLALTEVTHRMAAGDLSARAGFSRPDEIGSLGRAFNEMAGQVETTVATLRRFVSDAAHELHTPLTALRANLELAQDAPDPRAYLERAGAQVLRLEHLTNDLLDLSRIEAGPAEPEAVPLDLGRLAAQVSEPYATQAEQAGLDFSLDVPEEALLVTGQENRLAQAIGNLVDNALKFTPPGGRVAVSVRREGDQAVVEVRDSGIGITPEDLPVLFQRFHRGRNAAGYAGSGLGLSIVRAVVERHGGTVEAESGGTGAVFRMRLPVG